MKCPFCVQANASDAVFCAVCGKKIPRCPGCGAVLYQRSRFCENDGTPLPEELFTGFPPEPAPRPAAAPPPSLPPQAAGQPPQPLKKKKGRGPLAASIVLVVLLLAAAAAGGYFFLQGNLDLPFEKETREDPPSSKDDSWEEPEDKPKGEPEDDPAAEALAQARAYADSGLYEKALREIRSALEEEPDSSKLLDAQAEYIAAFETDILEQAEALAESGNVPAAIQTVREGLETAGTESGVLYEKLRQLEEETAHANSAAPISMDAVTSVDASSYLTQSSLSLYHTPDRTLDGDRSTAWVEGADGDGIGESITFTFDGVYLVSGMQICAGYQKSEDLYGKNARPAVLTVRFSSGAEQTAALQDINGPQEIDFDVPAETDSVTLTIASVYPGSKYEDTVITEVSFY